MHQLRLAPVVLLSVLGCKAPTEPAAPAPPPVVSTDMPLLERRPLSIADADLPDRFFSPAAVGPNGEVVYFTALGSQPIFRIVDSTGQRIGGFGRQGEGPGEFRLPLQLRVYGDSIRIQDFSRLVSIDYSMAGKYQGERNARILKTPLAWLRDSVDIWDLSPTGATATPAVVRQALDESKGRTVIPATDSGLQHLADVFRARPRPVIPYAAGAGRVYLADPYAYRIHSYDASGKPLAVFGRDLPPHFRGPQELAQVREAVLRAQRPVPGPNGRSMGGQDQGRRLDTLAKEITAYFHRTPLHVDRAGRLWVIGTTNDSTTIDVFADTTFLGRTTLPCFLLVTGYPAVLNGGWLLLECTLPDTADRRSELQLYRVLDPVRQPPKKDAA